MQSVGLPYSRGFILLVGIRISAIILGSGFAISILHKNVSLYHGRLYNLLISEGILSVKNPTSKSSPTTKSPSSKSRTKPL